MGRMLAPLQCGGWSIIAVPPAIHKSHRSYWSHPSPGKTLRPRRKACLLPDPMGHNKGSDNVKKRAARRKKTERLALAKATAAAATAAK